MKRFYAQGWIRTALKYIALTGIYMILLGFSLSIVTMLAILRM